ncbi:MAG TPA: potassium channel family protein [Bacilli bacterium]|nr:potassium channel family protein [Bacilli bacterium]
MHFGRLLYEVFIILMVLTYSILIFADPQEHPFMSHELIKAMDWGLIAFFAVEYLIRLYRAKDPWTFTKQNWFDVIAMIPFDQFFPLARLMRVVRLFRILHASPMLWAILTSRQMKVIFFIMSMVILWSSAGIYLLEAGLNDSIMTFGDAVWWAVVTTTTVGYGDISPITAGGRIIAGFLMFTGIGLISTFTANLANHWMTFFRQPDDKNEEPTESEIVEELFPPEDHIQNQMKQTAMNGIRQIEELSDAEYQRLLHLLEVLRKPPQQDE